MHKCYICGNKKTERVKGKVRDIPDLKILKCTKCGLVYLENFNHIDEKYYQNSNMNDFGNLEKYVESCVENDNWRIDRYEGIFGGKIILDFGCGLGGFIKGMYNLGHTIYGIDLDPTWKKVNPEIDSQMYENLESIPDGFLDYITMFHVVEHLKNPREIIRQIISKLKKDGKLIIEVPNADDALLTMYDCEAFQNFTYWSAHLRLFNQTNIKRLIEQSGLKCHFVHQLQRYPISNHLYWLAKGKPGGHKIWNFLDNGEVNKWYSEKLSDSGNGDTLLAYGGK